MSKFDGGLIELVARVIGGAIVTAISFGFLYPWAVCNIYGWKINHTVIDGKRLHFDGSAIGLFGTWVKWCILIWITFGIYGFWVGIKLTKWKTKHTHFA